VLKYRIQVDLGYPVPECLFSGFLLLELRVMKVVMTTGAIRCAKLTVDPYTTRHKSVNCTSIEYKL